jgi:hypothetical protein
MADIVDVVIPVEAEAAALLDARKPAAVGRIVSRMLCPQPDFDQPDFDPPLDTIGASGSRSQGQRPDI